MEIGTVNFDDLFDFSPEPQQQSAHADQSEPAHVDQSGPAGEHAALDRLQDTSKNYYTLQTQQQQQQQMYQEASGQQQQQHLNPYNNNSSSGNNNSYCSNAQQVGQGGGETYMQQLWEDLPDSDTGSGGEGGGDIVEEERRGRKGKGGDARVKLERSRQSARECRARKKLRYQYLDEMILEREKANMVLRAELNKYVGWCRELDMGRLPDGWHSFIQVKEETVEGPGSDY